MILRVLSMLLTLGIPLTVVAETPATWGALGSGPHGVGFQLVEGSDTSRWVRPDSTSRAAWPRPLRMYVWYPAKTAADAEAMTFGRYADLATDDVWPESILGSARERTAYANRPLARSLGSDGFAEPLEILDR